MPRRRAVLAAALALAGALAHADPSPREEALQMSELHWNHFRRFSDARSLAPLLSERWVLTQPDGKVLHKKDYLELLAASTPLDGRIESQESVIQYFGDTAIVTGRSLQSGAGAQAALRFTHTWVWQDGRWLMVAAHASRAQ